VSAGFRRRRIRPSGHQAQAGRKSFCLAVLVGVFFRSVFVVFGGVQMMAMRDLGVMRRLFMIARFVMFCRLAMVFRGLLMVVCRLLMVLVDLVFRHFSLAIVLLSRR
jgi:hypothetical protein